MKNLNFIVILGIAIFMATCKKDDPPPKQPELYVSIHSTVDQVTDSSASVHAYLQFDGTLNGYGIVYSSTNALPTFGGVDCEYISSNNLEGNTFTAVLNNLTSGTVYYLAAYAKIDNQYIYSETDTLGTNGYLTDIEGNTYRIVRIGDLYWMADNLKTTKYNDGTDIPNLTDHTDWSTDTIGACCWYDNNSAFKQTYGALYNWYAANTNKLAPSGWHVSTGDDWQNLNTYVNSDAKSIMSEDGWYDVAHQPANEGTNRYGFNALPAGCRDADKDYYTTFFIDLFMYTAWWRIEEGINYGVVYGFHYFSTEIASHYVHKESGYSVRCVRDE